MHDALKPLKYFKQFTNYILRPLPDGRTDKIPTVPVDNPSKYLTYDEAAAISSNIGFIFTSNDPFFFIDVDDCRTDVGWNDTAMSLMGLFDGCAIEVSQSGKGLHIIGVIPTQVPHSCDNKILHTQFYTEKRFVAITNMVTSGSASFVPSIDIYSSFVKQYFEPHVASLTGVWTTEPVPEYTGPEDDELLLEKIRKSKSAAASFGGKAPVIDLLDLNEEVLMDFYEDPRRPFDWSRVEAALCQHLAFWTGKNCQRIEEIMSGLPWVRDKWLSREEYRRNTILKAVAGCKSVYNVPSDPVPVSEEIYLTVAEQREFFEQFVYIRDYHQVLTPDGNLLSPDQFRTAYSKGKIFTMDTVGSKVVSDAWKAFTQSTAHQMKMAFTTCFKPEFPPGYIEERENYRYVNTYVNAGVKSTPGDVSPFLNLVSKIMPEKLDRDIILSYMAACVQYPGVKFQWCPLIQGTDGNGKTFLASCVSKAVGERYTHSPNSQDLTNKFNDWMYRRLFIIVEEVYLGGRDDIMENLKVKITNRNIEIHPKNRGQFMGQNRANFWLCTNHKDAIRKTRNDRRLAVFYTPQQSRQDIIDHGMSDRYFHELYTWARQGGYAHVTYFLQNYKIHEAYDPAGICQTAPNTSSTSEAYIASMGPVAQEVLEACAEDRPGFSGGWISSIAFTELVAKRIQSAIERKKLLEDMGYIPHPHLKEGRVTAKIGPERGKPRLYIKQGHLCQNVTDPVVIRKLYMKAQEYMVDMTGVNEGYYIGTLD